MLHYKIPILLGESETVVVRVWPSHQASRNQWALGRLWHVRAATSFVHPNSCRRIELQTVPVTAIRCIVIVG